MLQLAQYQDGRLELQEVPAPLPPPGGILVRNLCSVISPGTEKMKVEQARMSLLQKARARPDQVRKVLDTARTLGWRSAMDKVRNRLESPSPLGYSSAGVVVAVDPANTRFRVGDRVACGGAECAFHAEMIGVPNLLAAPIPEGVEAWQAAYTTLASISMEAVRQSGARLGERVLIMGQGLVGLLASQLLKASGARVMVTDLMDERLALSLATGAERVVNPKLSNLEDEVEAWTGGQGVDAVLICVGGKDRAIADVAIQCLRDRGVLVIVGMYDAELTWKTAYIKDIQVRYSRSYGAGRYDPDYEWGGKDYPIGHVRWTENRHFEACLHLMKTGQLDLAPLTTRRVSFVRVLSVYDQLDQEIGVVIDYPEPGAGPELVESRDEPAQLASDPPSSQSIKLPCKSLDVIGAGNFVRTMLLPHLRGQISLRSIVNSTGLSARHVKEKFGFEQADTEVESVFAKPGDALLIGTRHHLHAPLVLRGLEAAKHVFVEKPLCLTRDELEAIDLAVTSSKGSVMVGFNRRFAPASAHLQKVLAAISGPKVLAYHVFAGALAPDHWYARLDESGGRVLGEAVHFFDYACFLLGSPLRVTAQCVGRQDFPDSITAQIEFSGGSSAQIIYSAAGDHAFPKETFRVFAPGLVAECEKLSKSGASSRSQEQSDQVSRERPCRGNVGLAWISERQAESSDGLLRSATKHEADFCRLGEHPLRCCGECLILFLNWAVSARQNRKMRLGQQISWYCHRLRAMSPVEVCHRLGARWRIWTEGGFLEGLQPLDHLDVNVNVPRLPAISVFPESTRSQLATDARRLLRGDWQIFGWRDVNVGAPPCWHRDPASGVVIDPDRPAHSLDHRHLPDGADSRSIWEINRWAEMTRLAMHGWINDDLEAIRTAQIWIEDWCDRNPPGLGINWTSPLEVALRLLNFTWFDALVQAAEKREKPTCRPRCPVFFGKTSGPSPRRVDLALQIGRFFG